MRGAGRFAIVLVLFIVGLGASFALQRISGVGGTREGGGARPGTAPRRIIALAPSVTECLFALGAGDQVVGVGDFCFHPPEAKGRPRAGGEFNPSFEQILALKPDLVVVQGRAEKLHEFCRRHGIRILHVDMDSLDTIRSGLRELGRAAGREAEASRVVASMDLELAGLERLLAGRPRPTAFLCMGHQPGSLRGLSTASGRSFLSEALAVAGGRSVFADVHIPYPPVSKEALLERAPDVILDLHPGEALSDEARRLLLADWTQMGSLPAVRQGRVHILTEDYLMIPGPRVVQLARRLAEVLHPDVAKERSSLAKDPPQRPR